MSVNSDLLSLVSQARSSGGSLDAYTRYPVLSSLPVTHIQAGYHCHPGAESCYGYLGYYSNLLTDRSRQLELYSVGLTALVPRLPDPYLGYSPFPRLLFLSATLVSWLFLEHHALSCLRTFAPAVPFFLST